MSVSEMASVGQVQTKDRVAGLQQRHVSSHVGLRTGMRLDVGMFCAEKLLGAVTGQGLDYISKFASAIIAPSGIPLCILIGKDRTCSLKHRLADKIFGGNQLQPIMLAFNFVGNG